MCVRPHLGHWHRLMIYM
ncbi:hypothetical protein F383_25299 [Gossypium arboreum]|uniref:Uncharacterized protein n=1 Tax=Gossypium arboreum TaxID=29729 RepID=A0A0B0P125_GOSAR|nr:hypothetical protein F383_25299 [Gossypium arboreum]